MKRGNTALKRVVSVASVAGMALALAVVAAPAASAAAATPTTEIRTMPTVDAAYAGASFSALATYISAGGTGQAASVAIGQSWQTTSGIQVLLNAGGAAWATGDEITLKAPANVKFSANPTVTLSKNSVLEAGWGTLAGHTGTNAHAFTKGDGTLASNTVGIAGSGTDTITITLPDPTESVAGTAGTNGYLLSVTGLRVNLGADYDPTVRELNVTVDNGAVGAAVTTTPVTVAYVNSLGLSVKGDSNVSGTDVTLPSVIVSEAVKNAFPDTAAAGTPANLFEVTVTGTANDATGLTLSTADAKLAAPSSVKLASVTNPATGVFGVELAGPAVGTLGTTSDASVESVGISGLKVGNVKPGTELTLTITKPVATSPVPAAATGNGASVQSGGAAVTVKPTSSVPRIFGANRYATAGKIAAAGAWSGDAVIIANGVDAKQGVDALSANFLAGALNAPVLLTQSDTLPADTESALKDLFDGSSAAVTVYYMGKTDSISQAVRDKVEAAIAGVQSVVGSVKTKDVAGDDRYATSVETAKAVDVNQIASYDLGNGNLRTAFLASGQVNADALAAGAVSADANIPVLLTNDADALPKSVSDAISSLHIEQVIILGSTDRVSQKVEDALKDAKVSVSRLAGSDRYATAADIAQLAIDTPTDGLGTTTSGTIYLANGNGGWADALTAGALVAQTHNSLVTVSDSGSLPTSTVLFLSKNNTLLANVEGLGGTDRVADSAITQAQALVK